MVGASGIVYAQGNLARAGFTDDVVPASVARVPLALPLPCSAVHMVAASPDASHLLFLTRGGEVFAMGSGGALGFEDGKDLNSARLVDTIAEAEGKAAAAIVSYSIYEDSSDEIDYEAEDRLMADADAALSVAKDNCFVVAIAAANQKSAAVTSTGRLFCWGMDSGKGELGWWDKFGNQKQKALKDVLSAIEPHPEPPIPYDFHVV